MPRTCFRICWVLIAAAGLSLASEPRALGKGGNALGDAREICFSSEMRKNVRRIIDACAYVIKVQEPEAARQSLAHFRRGDALRRRGRLYEAQKNWSQAVTIDRNNIPARLQLARLEIMSNRFESALAHYRYVSRLSPRNAEAYHGAGMALRRIGDLDEALGAFAAAVQADPELWMSHVEAAKVHQLRRDIKKAMRSHAEAIAVYRKDKNKQFFQFWSHPKIERARYLNMIGRTRDAIKDLTAAIAQLGNHYGAYALRAEFYENVGDYERAARDQGAMIGFLPAQASGGHLFTRARLYQKIGNVEAAIKDMEEAIRLGGVQSILKMQVFLKNNGYDQVEINGKYSIDMRRALKRCMQAPTCTKGLTTSI